MIIQRENNLFKRLTRGLNDKGKLIPASDSVFNHIKNRNLDYYLSINQYNNVHNNIFKEKKSVKGITDVECNQLVFDFDHNKKLGQSLEDARVDTIEAINRLKNIGVEDHHIQLYFSGNKGFCIVINLDECINPKIHKNIAKNLCGDLQTWDTKVYDAARVLRVPCTKHPVSKLYKIPLTIEELNDSVDNILEWASEEPEPDTYEYRTFKLPKKLLVTKEPEKPKTKELVVANCTLDFKNKPKFLSDWKYALSEGYFPPGSRNIALMILAATYKNEGFSKRNTYYVLKGASEAQSERFGQEKYSKEQLWKEIIKVVFDIGWNGGTYAEENFPEEISEYLLSIGVKRSKDAEEDFRPKRIIDIAPKFKDYVKNIDKNRIITGIKTIDDNLFISTGTNMALLGAPASGKTSICLDILRNTSKAGVKSVFASLDMTSSRVFEKVHYKLGGYQRDALYKMYDGDQEDQAEQLIQDNFDNVFLFDKAQPSVADIDRYIDTCEQKSGEKVKLVMIDYFERIFSEISDDTASSKKVAGQLQNLINNRDICLITLVQPAKYSGDLSEPISSYYNIKGSSFLGQSFRVITAIYREGFSPDTPKFDKYLTFRILKNDLGDVGSFDFAWNGKRGEISELDDLGKSNLKKLRAIKKDDETGYL
jgi:replicative DNA helicase